MFGLNNSSPRSDSFSMIGFHFISSELSNRVVHIAFAPSCSLALKNPILRPEVYVKMLSRLPRFFNAYFLSPTLSLHFFHLANTHVHQHSNSNGTIITRSLPFNCQITGTHSSAFVPRENRIRIACPRKLTENVKPH